MDPIVVIHWGLQGAAIALGVGTLVVTRRRPMWVRLSLALALPLLVVVLRSWWCVLILRPVLSDWSEARLAPSLALRLGYALYSPPDRGVVSGWIYPPMATLLYLPATGFADPAAMILAGRCLSLAFYFGPVVWLLTREARSGGLSPALGLLLFGLFAVWTNDSLALRYVSTEIVADNPALGFGAITLGLLGTRSAPRPDRTIALAILAATLAVWSKQIAVPLIGLPALWCLAQGGRRPFLRALIATGWIGGGLSLGFSELFDPSAVYFHLVVVPSRHPWKETTLEGMLRASWSALSQDLVVFTIPAVGLIVMGAIHLRRGSRSQAPHVWPTWLPFLTAAVVELPFGLLGFSKVGGYVNSLAHIEYYAAIAGLLLLGQLARAVPRLAWVVLALALATAIAGHHRITATLADRWPPWNDEQARGENWIDEQRRIARYLREHPGEAYFPGHPLAHLAVEGVPVHFEYGVYDRDLAGFPINAAHLRRHIPPGTRRLIYPGGRSYCGYFLSRALPEFARPGQIPDWPGAMVLERSSAIESDQAPMGTSQVTPRSPSTTSPITHDRTPASSVR